MELSREEVYKNKKVSVGVTLLSFIVMLAFFIFTKVISANSSSLNTTLPHLELGMDNSGSNPDPVKSTVAAASARQETSSSDKLLNHDGEVALKNVANEVSDKYKAFEPKTHITNSDYPAPETPASANTTGTSVLSAIKSGSSPFGFYLPERSVITRPAFENSTREEGTVVVEIAVDKNGIVLEADPNGRGTTTNSTALKNEARRIALATLFNKDPTSEEQRGTIIIIFSFR